MPEILPPTDATIVDCQAAEYHADHSRISRSMLSDFLRDPALYYGRHVTRTLPQIETTDAMQFGTALHGLLLQTDDAPLLIPDDVLSSSGSRAGNSWKAFQSANAGRVLMKRVEFERLNKIALSVTMHDDARRLLNRGGHEIPGWRAEATIHWTDADTGLPCKARLDALDAAGGIITDIKTTRDSRPKAFAETAWRFGYHRQAAWYTDAVASLTGFVTPEFRFPVVETDPPYTTRVYRLTDDFVAIGRDDNRRAMRGIAERCSSGDWTAPDASGVIEIAPPRWAKYADEYLLPGDE
jgi:hypothetical protein